MAIKIVVYSDQYLTNVVDEVTGFSNAREAAHHRDNSELWDKYTQLQQDTKSNSYYSGDDRHLADDGGEQEAPRQVVRYHKGMKRENIAQFKAAAILALLGVGFVASLFMFIVSLLS